MTSIGRMVRVVLATAVLTTAGIGFAGSAGAVSTGSLTPVTNGVTVTYSSPNTGADGVFVMIYPSPHTCAAGDNPGTATYFLMSENAGPAYVRLGASPRTLEFGSTVSVNGGSASGTIAAGIWEVCLVWNNQGSFTVLSSATMTAVDPSPPTTSTPTTTPSSPTTGANGSPGVTEGDPMAPAFTG